MKGIAKKALILAIAAACAAAMCFAACSSSHEDENQDTKQTQTDSTDSGDTIIEETIVNNNYLTMTDEQFQEYLDYISTLSAGTDSTIETAAARSVFSSVSILTTLMYAYKSGPGGSSNQISYYYDAVYYGSGVIVDLDKDAGDAYVLTNAHVVYDDTAVTAVSDRVYLYLYGQDIEYVNYTVESETSSYSGKKYNKYNVANDDDYRIETTVVAVSAQYDLALLKVEDSDVLKDSNAIAATFSDDEEVYAGQAVYMVGNPLGDGTTVTSGVVSQDSIDGWLNINSSVYSMFRQIKTDATVNGGNSGGALYNSSGEIIGIINSKLVGDEIENNGFALAGSYVKRIYELMRDTADGTQVTDEGISRPYLKGAYEVTTTYYSGYGYYQDAVDTGYDITHSASYLDISSGTPKPRKIEEVSANTTSYGLEEGDVITHLSITDKQGNTVEDLDITRKFMLDDALISYRDGYTVTLTYTRNSVEYTKNVSCQWYDVTVTT